MNANDALKLGVRHFPGGLEVIAVRIGKPEETLRKELSGSDPKFKLGLTTAVLISDLLIEAKSAHCYGFVNAIAGNAGRMLELPVVDMPLPKDLPRSVADAVREMADVVVAATDSDSDDVISDNDVARTLKEIAEAYSALQRLELCLRAKNAAGKPTTLRAA